jgi:hypothetical protein
MANTGSWDEFHALWRRVEAAVRGGAQNQRGPISELLEQAARSGRISSSAAAELDAFRRLRNLDSHEGVAGSGARLCSPNEEAITRLRELAEQIECPLPASKVMTKAATCSTNTTLGDAVSKLRDGEGPLFYRNGKGWAVFDREEVSRIVERNAKGARTSVDLERSIGEHLDKAGHREVMVLPANATAKQAAAAVRAVMAGDGSFMGVIRTEARSAWVLTWRDVESVERRLVR